MVKRRAVKRGSLFLAMLALPALLTAQVRTPNITSIQSGFGSATNGAAITAGTPTPASCFGSNICLNLFINGNFQSEGVNTQVTWNEGGVPTSLPLLQISTTQIVVNVPMALYQAAGSASITVSETLFADVPPPPSIDSATFTVNPALAGTTLPAGVVGQPYSQPFFTGGTGPFTVAFRTSPAPPGLAATPSTGNPLAGSPSQSGTFAVNRGVTDGWGNLINLDESVTIIASLAITTPTLATGVIGHTYTSTVQAVGGVTPYGWSAAGLPAGLSISPTTGVISGTPTASGTFPVTVTVTDSGGANVQNAQRQYSLQINSALTITTTSLATGVIQHLYTSTVAANGGVTPYAWAAAGLPAGLSISPTTGVISGTPTASGTFPVTVTVTDSGAASVQSAQATLSLQIFPTLSIGTTFLPNGRLQQAYNTTIAATGGDAPYTWAATGLPAGLSINAGTGVISGTPTASGTFSVVITVTDSGGSSQQTAHTTLPLQINSVLTITTTSLPSGRLQQAYNTTVAAVGGVTPYTWAATGLPAGLSINTGTGAISGTPTASGAFSVVVTVTDSGGEVVQNAQKTLPLQINALLNITTASLPTDRLQLAYSTTLAATGGAAPYTWSVTGLPGGLSVNSGTGVVSGTPTASGAFSIVVTVTDSGGEVVQSAQKTFPLQINTLVNITTASLPNGRAQLAYSAAVTATGGVAPYTWAATGLPAGLSINAGTGVISGTPAASGTFPVNVSVTDSGAAVVQTVQTTFSLQIFAVLTITTSGLPAGLVNQGYSTSVSASGGVPPYTWSASGLPLGFVINSATGVITGTPFNSGPNQVIVRVTDSGGPLVQSAQANFQLLINPAPPAPLQITTGALANGVAGQAYGALIAASGGAGNYVFALTGGSLPGGVLFATGGQIAGTPIAPGSFSFTAQVTDGAGATVSRGFSILITPGPLTITGSAPSTVAVNSTISAAFAGAGGVAPYKLALSGTPPAGTGFSNGVLSGVASTPGIFSFTISASDSQTPPATTSQSFTITVTAAPIVISASLPPGTVLQPYSGQLSATGGTGGFTWTGSGNGGLSVSSSGGVSGTPTATGTFSITATVTDSSGTKATGTFSVTIAGPLLTVATTSLPPGALNTPYSAALAATGGTPPYTWAVTGLPDGLSASSTGAISGTPATLGTSGVSVVVTDHDGNTAKASFSITIGPQTLAITTTGLSPVTLGASFSVGFGATGGTPPYTWTATGLPSGVSISSTGTVSGTPTAVGTTSITVTVTDANGQKATQGVSLVVALPPAPPTTIVGLPATGTSGSQASAGITFNQPFPVDVTVTLTLTFAPTNGPDDPNVQFATGGRTATVTVKAGSTTSLTNVGVQTGTVSGVITITAQLTAVGGGDVTPTPAPVSKITIGASAPTISSVTAATTSTGFSVTVIGFDPTRSITQVTFTFTPAAGSNLTTTTVTVPAQSLFATWFQSSASAPFGSQFNFTIPFTVTGSVSGIASVTVTITNPTGTSTSVTAPI